MKKFLLSIVLITSINAHSQEKTEQPDETVEVEGERIHSKEGTVSGFGPGLIFMGGAGSGPGGGSHPKASPFKTTEEGGQTQVKDKNDKDAINERNKTLTLEKGMEIAGKIKGGIIDFGKAILKAVTWKSGETSHEVIIAPDGTRTEIAKCAESALNTEFSLCNKLQIKKITDGSGVERFLVAVTAVDGCFTARENTYVCKPQDVVNFVFDDEQELIDLMNSF